MWILFWKRLVRVPFYILWKMPKSVQMNLCKFMERQPFIWSFNMRGLSICPACYSWPHPTRKRSTKPHKCCWPCEVTWLNCSCQTRPLSVSLSLSATVSVIRLLFFLAVGVRGRVILVCVHYLSAVFHRAADSQRALWCLEVSTTWRAGYRCAGPVRWKWWTTA